MTPRRALVVASALLATVAAPGAAPGVADVRLRTRTITAEQAIAAPPAANAAMTTVVVAAAARVTPEWRQAVEAQGARLVTYLPERAFLARVPGERLGSLAAVPGTDFVAAYLPADKLAPELAAAAAAKQGARLPVHVLVAPDVPSARVADALRALGIEVAGAGDGGVFNDVVAFLPGGGLDLAARIAELPEVLWIEPRARRVLLNDLSYWVDQGGLETPYVTPIFDHGIRGAGQTVAVLDTGLDHDMCYFRDPAGTPPVNQNGATAFDDTQRKVVAYDFLWDQDDPADPADYDDHSHGTHVAGSVAGDDDAHLLGHDLGDGMAPAAKLVIQDGGYEVNDCADLPGIACPVVDLTPIFDQAYRQGARFHSNSWGDQENATPQNNYTAACVDTDDFMYTHPDFLILYAAGNGGGGGNDTVGSPSVAKSTISVGATSRGFLSDTLANFSSRGYAADGRLKPTVTAPGVAIRSAMTDGDITTGNCGTFAQQGTSMACPTAAGLSALAAEYYAAGYYPGGVRGGGTAFTPSAALIKATVVNSGRTMKQQTAIPSREQGWGRITLADTLAFPGGPRDLFVVDEKTGFATGATARMRYTVDVRSNAVPLKATLVWTDPPSNPIAATNLINDLDLLVSGPAGSFRGNVFAAGVSTPGGAADRLNVEEQVLIASPAPGMYDIDVTPFAVPSGPQPFALVVTGDLMTPFQLVYAGMTIVSEANGNGWIDPAEAIGLGFTLRNSSDQDAAQIAGTLTSLSPDVTVTDATASWPNIAAGASALSLADHFAIQVAPAVACGARVPMRLDVVAGFGRRVTVDFTLLVGGFVDHLVERFDTTPLGQVPAGFTVTSDNDPFGVAMCDDSVEPTATSPGPTSAPNALFIGKSGTDTQRTSTFAARSIALGPFAGRPSSLSFRWWSYDTEGGDRLVAALAPAGTAPFRWELLRTPTDYESMTTGGGLWGTTTLDLDLIPALASGVDNWLRFDASTSVSETVAGGGAGDGFYVDDVVLRTVQCSAACAASTVTPNSLRAVKLAAGIRVTWAGTPSGFNLHETVVPSDLPGLWNGAPLNPAPLPAPSFDVAAPLSPLALYRAFGADCTGSSVP